MTTLDALVKLLLLGAAIGAFSLTMTKAAITEPIRERVKGKSQFLGKLISCPYCFSHWVSGIAVLLTPNVHIYTSALLNSLTLIMVLVCFSSFWTWVVFNAYKK